MTTLLNGQNSLGMFMRSQMTFNVAMFYDFEEIFQINVLLKSSIEQEVM